MYDYSLNDEERKLFILKHEKVKINNEDKIKVYYADGSVDIIDDLDDNLDIIESKKDKQIDSALNNEESITRKINWSILNEMGLSTTACVAGTVIASNLPCDNEVKGIVVAGLGVIYLGSILYALKKSAPKKELAKLKYLRENLDILSTYSQHSNSLNGLNNRTKHTIRSRENPYSSLYVEDYNVSTLETIKDNIDRANHFNYETKKKR